MTENTPKSPRTFEDLGASVTAVGRRIKTPPPYSPKKAGTTHGSDVRSSPGRESNREMPYAITQGLGTVAQEFRGGLVATVGSMMEKVTEMQKSEKDEGLIGQEKALAISSLRITVDIPAVDDSNPHLDAHD